MSTVAKHAFRAAALVAMTGVLSLALPPVQLWLARSAANRLDGVELELGYVWAGPRGIALKGLHMAGADFTVNVREVDVDFGFWSSLARRQLDVEHATLRGVDVSAAAASSTQRREGGAEKRAAQVFAGLRPFAKIPGWLRLRALSAAGKVHVTTGQAAGASASWTLSAAGLAANSTASARFAGTLDYRRNDTVLYSAAYDTNASARIGADSRLRHLTLGADVHPVGGQRGVRLAANVAVDRAVERYTLDVRGRNGIGLARFDATLEPGGHLAGSWMANLPPEVLAAFARGRSAPSLSGTSTGRVQADLAARRAEIRSQTQIEGRGWERLDARLANLGSVRVAVSLDGAIGPRLVDLRTLQVDIGSPARGDMLQVNALQPLRVERGSWLLEPERWGEPALRVRADDMPLRWLRHFSPDRNLEGGRLSGVVDVVRDAPKRTTLLVSKPLKATGVTLRPVRGADMGTFDVTMTPRATLGDGALRAQIKELTITAKTGLRIRFEGRGRTSRAEWPRAQFDGRLSAHVPALQRVMPQLARLHAGIRVGFDFGAMQLTVTTANLGADAPDGREVFAADLSGREPLRVAIPRFEADWDHFEPRSASLRLDRLSIAWVSAYIPELALRSGRVSGRFTASGSIGRGLELGTDGPLVIANVLPVYRGRAAKRTVSISVRPHLFLSNARSTLSLEDLRVRGRGMDELRGNIRVDAPAGRDQLSISLGLDGDFPSLARDYGSRIRKLHLRQRTDFEPALDRFTVRDLALDLADTDDRSFLSVRSTRPFYVFSRPFAVGVKGGSTEILRATVTPLRLQDLVPKIAGLDLRGYLPAGEFFGRAEADGRLVLAADKPLVFRDVSVRWGRAALLDRVTTSVEYELAYSAGGLEARSGRLSASGPDGRVLARLTMQAMAPLTDKRLLERARVSIDARLAALARQPILADVPTFTAGDLQANLNLDRRQRRLTIGARLRGAVAEQVGRLPDLDLDLDAQGVRGDHMKLTVPLRLESPASGRSDLRFSGSAQRAADGTRHFEATLSGQRVVISDLDRLAELFENPSEESPAEESSGGGRSGPNPLSAERRSAIRKLRRERQDTPIWTDHVVGSTTVNLHSVVFPSFTVDGVQGDLEVSPERAALRNIKASLFGASLDASGRVGFDAAAAKPYTLDFTAGIDELDLGKLFRAVAPGENPMAEGRFDVETSLTGAGYNPLDLALSSLGELRITGRNGIFRGLAPQPGRTTAARVIGFLTFSKELKAVGRLLDGLSEIKFQKAEVALERPAPDRIDVRKLFVESPQLRIDASGSLGLERLQPLLLSPLDLSTRIAARGDVATLFRAMGLLEDKADDSGYRSLTQPIELGGSPAEPDASAFWELLDKGAHNAGGSFGRALRIMNRRLEKKRANE